MFDNIGRKVKGLAVFTCVIGIIGSIIGAIILWVDEEYGFGFLALIGGCLSSWIGAWSLYAIGQAAENSDEQLRIAKENQEILKRWTVPETANVKENGNVTPGSLSKNSESYEPFTTKTGSKISDSLSDTQTAAGGAHAEVKPNIVEDGKFYVCPVCNTKQQTNRTVCYHCGTKFIK